MDGKALKKPHTKILMMPEPKVPSEIFWQHNYYGEKYPVYVTDEEADYPDGCLITSRTDTNGIITHANDAFVELSGWTREELTGCPHCVLRHPDMPAVVFRDLWETLQAGRKWFGYVKNLRKDGGFYWVYATVIPNVRNGRIQGYTSVRRKPAKAKVEEAAAYYAQLRAGERAGVFSGKS